VVNQVSKRPTPAQQTEATASVTTNGLVRATADTGGALGDHAAFRLAAMAQSGATSTRDKTTAHDFGLAPSLVLDLGPATRTTIIGLYQHNRDRPDYGLPPLNGEPANIGSDTIFGYSDDRTIQDVGALEIETTHKVSGALALRNQLQVNLVDTDARETAAQGLGLVTARGYAPLTPAGISALPLSALSVRLQSHDRIIHDRTYSDQLEAKASFATLGLSHSLVVGAEIDHDDYRNQTLTRTGSCNGVAMALTYVGCVSANSPAYGASPVVADARASADAGALYANDEIALPGALTLVAGLRQDVFSAKITNTINRDNTKGSTVFASQSQTVDFTSVRSGLLWKPAPHANLYLSWSTSFNPSLEQLTTTTGLSSPLPPETSEAFEAGAKIGLARDRLKLTAAAFRIEKDNARSQNADNTYDADGDIRVEGLRFGLEGRLSRNWQIMAGYSRMDARIIKAIAVGTEGKVPLNTPRDSGNLWTLYDLTPEFQIGGGLFAQSRRYLNNTNLVSAPGYVRLDATAAWRRGPLEVRLNLQNLAGVRYYDNLIQSDGGRATPGSGRTLMLTLSWKG
jgi:catecholate siderophore receptor